MESKIRKFIKYTFIVLILTTLLIATKHISKSVYMKDRAKRTLVATNRVLGLNSDEENIEYDLVRPELANTTTLPIPKMPDYALVNKNLCKDPRIRYLVYTYSAPGHFEGREAIRKTYGNKNIYKDKRMERVFFLAQTKDAEIQHKIEEEAKKYGDIVQANYIDSYPNLTLKGIFTFKFFNDFCRKNVIAIKTDDDLFYDIFLFMDKFKNPTPRDRYVGCPVFQERSMPILRDPKKCAKWCVKDNELIGKEFYPRYCSGWVWIFPLNFVGDMMRAIERTTFFRVEDAFISGILMGQVAKLKYVDVFPYFPNPPAGRTGIWRLAQQYTNMTVPRKWVLADVPNTKTLLYLWKLCIESLHTKSKETLKELNLDAVLESIVDIKEVEIK